MGPSRVAPGARQRVSSAPISGGANQKKEKRARRPCIGRPAGAREVRIAGGPCWFSGGALGPGQSSAEWQRARVGAQAAREPKQMRRRRRRRQQKCSARGQLMQNKHFHYDYYCALLRARSSQPASQPAIQPASRRASQRKKASERGEASIQFLARAPPLRVGALLRAGARSWAQGGPSSARSAAILERRATPAPPGALDPLAGHH